MGQRWLTCDVLSLLQVYRVDLVWTVRAVGGVVLFMFSAPLYSWHGCFPRTD